METSTDTVKVIYVCTLCGELIHDTTMVDIGDDEHEFVHEGCYRLMVALVGEDVEPLNEVCEHGCHIDDTYGFVVMMGCPVHD